MDLKIPTFFWTRSISGSYEFDCEVNAMTGEIVKFEKEYDGAAVSNVSVEEHGEQSEHSQTEENQAVSNISLEKAKEIALSHAGVASANAFEMEGKLDWDDGMSIYEIEFKAGGYEYSYEVDAATGSIVEFDKEWDD